MLKKVTKFACSTCVVAGTVAVVTSGALLKGTGALLKGVVGGVKNENENE